MSDNGISFKSYLERDQVISYLEDLCQSLKSGKLYIKRGDKGVELSPADSIEMELEVAEKKGKQKLAIELSWQPPVVTGTSDAGLVISHQAPEPEPVEPSEPQPGE